MISTSNSQINNSTSKARYSFGKQQRKTEAFTSTDKMYQLPSMVSKRSTSFGFGNKINLSGLNFSPSPDKYEKHSDFQKSPKKGQTFGVSRQQFKAACLFASNRFPGPGPGSYDSNVNKVKESTKIYTIQKFLRKSSEDKTLPGPTDYDLGQCSDKKFYTNSKCKSPHLFTIPKAKNKQNLNKVSPIGPNFYRLSTNSIGKQVLAKKRTETSFCFSKYPRDKNQRGSSKVGPGSYEFFSQFGK